MFENPEEGNIIQQPLQKRSVETMNRIMDAATVLLEDKPFDKLTIAEVVSEAGCSVGAFYGRFRDKQALLIALDKRYYSEFIAGAQALLERLNSGGAGIAASIFEAAKFLVGEYGRRRGLLRALEMNARLNLSSSCPELEAQAWGVLPMFCDHLKRFGCQIRHPDPDLALQLGSLQMFYAMREMLLWCELEHGYSVSDEVLVQELTRSFLAYLGVESEMMGG